MYSKIEIKSKGKTPTVLTEVLIDGKPIKGIRSLKFQVYPNSVPILTLEVNALDVSIDSETTKISLEHLGEVEKIVFADGEQS